MEVEPVFASHILGQLRARNVIEASFSGIIGDYQVLLKRNRELHVRTPHSNCLAGESTLPD